jgi:hypothetical protein
MRIVLVLILLINLGVFALGQGVFGTPPAEKGRSTKGAPEAQLNPEAVVIAPGRFQTR